MAAISWADVEALASELSSISVGAQDSILAYVNTQLTVSEFGGEESPNLRLARLFLAAHLGTIHTEDSKGAVVSESEDGLSRSYASVSSGDTFKSTSYGRTFLIFVRVNSIPIIVP